MAANSATVRILIKGGKVVNDDFTHEADVYIENGIIQQVGRELMIPGGAKVIDATGKLVIPGGIDTSAHLQQSFMNATSVDDFYSGTKLPSSDPNATTRHILGTVSGTRAVTRPALFVSEFTVAGRQTPVPALSTGSDACRSRNEAEAANASAAVPRGTRGTHGMRPQLSVGRGLCILALVAVACEAQGCLNGLLKMRGDLTGGAFQQRERFVTASGVALLLRMVLCSIAVIDLPHVRVYENGLRRALVRTTVGPCHGYSGHSRSSLWSGTYTISVGQVGAKKQTLHPVMVEPSAPSLWDCALVGSAAAA
ncbi:hypothetical protein Z043_123348 [Scleropages formosus]|uniref:Amidohydrolase-related domain-containing protein n=1 Tax=Scleropages formosus TaxID=113540 RepID=A0A0P7UDP2_SCLFO|nr:hypothetical protein Z043_123348 [Scleropages formosus]